MKHIITVQHTQSVHHTNGMVGSWTDWDLTDLGKEQADHIGKKLKEELSGKKVVMYSSDLKRAKQTAEEIAKYLYPMRIGIYVSGRRTYADLVTARAEGNFTTDNFVGTIANEGLDIAPFHDYESQLPEGLADKIKELKSQIADGTIVVESDSAFPTE